MEQDMMLPPIHPFSCGTKVSSDYTDQDYTVWFNGTSAAAPHVAGVATLILSVNPNLTALQVRNIIESTAQKVGGYSYQSTSAHPNGTWHQEMGYGLVNAYAAVQTCVMGVNYFNQTVSTNTTVTSCGNINSQNVKVQSGVKLILDAAGETTIIKEFEVPLGAELEIK
jgi:subtilisin family serine protease